MLLAEKRTQESCISEWIGLLSQIGW